MDEVKTAGWFPNPDAPGSLRYWDGERWTDHLAPAPPTAAPAAGGPSAFTIAVGVALGVLAVLAGLFVINQVASSDDDLDCARENVERAQQGLPRVDCD